MGTDMEPVRLWGALPSPAGHCHPAGTVTDPPGGHATAPTSQLLPEGGAHAPPSCAVSTPMGRGGVEHPAVVGRPARPWSAVWAEGLHEGRKSITKVSIRPSENRALLLPRRTWPSVTNLLPAGWRVSPRRRAPPGPSLSALPSLGSECCSLD